MQKNKTTKRVGEIEFFRFIFSMCIVLCHVSKYILKTNKGYFSGGALAVEFFFILSGYLMMASIYKRISAPTQSLGGETLGFIFKKITAVYPEFIVSFIIAFGVNCYANSLGFSQAANLMSKNIFTMFLIPFTGLGNNSINGAVWYIQSMLLCMCILYPLIRKFPDIMIKLVMPVTALLLLGWIYQNYGNLGGPTSWLGFTFKGNVRAFAELCIGALSFNVAKVLSQYSFRKWWRYVLTLIKWGCWILSLYLMYSVRQAESFVVILLIAVAITLTFSQQCTDFNLFQNRFVLWLGKISLPIYLNHFYFSCTINKILPKTMSNSYKVIILFVLTAVASAIVMICAALIRAFIPKFKKIILNNKQI